MCGNRGTILNEGETTVYFMCLTDSLPELLLFDLVTNYTGLLLRKTLQCAEEVLTEQEPPSPQMFVF